ADVVAAFEWKRGDLRFGDDRTERTRRRLDERGFPSDGYGLLDRSELEQHVENGFLPDEQTHAAPDRRPVARELRADFIGTYRQRRKPEGAVAAGRNAPRQARIDIPDGDRCTWQNAAGIPDHTHDGGGGLREKRRSNDDD